MQGHQPGRIDFDGPLAGLLRRGWGFREFAPQDEAREGFWGVVGVCGDDRVRADRPDRADAWAEAVRLAQIGADDRDAGPTAPLVGPEAAPPKEPTACDEERARLGGSGWSFSEHPTALAGGRAGWVVSGSRGGQRIRAADEDRSVAWGTALLLAATDPTASAGRPEGAPPEHDGRARDRPTQAPGRQAPEALVIRRDGSFVLSEGGLLEFVRHLEDHGTRCGPTGMTASDRSDAPVPEAHLHRPFDFDRVQDLYRDWVKGRA
jgi:hypothetical protein